MARKNYSGIVIASAVLCCAVLCCAVLCCAANFDTKREIMSSRCEKICDEICFFLHEFANIICIITRKFDFRGKIGGKFKKIRKVEKV